MLDVLKMRSVWARERKKMKKYSTIKNMILVVAVLLLFISIYNYFSMFIFHPTLNYYIATAGVFVEDIAITLILLSISGSIKSIKNILCLTM